MELKAFVSSAILDIVNGVRDAQEKNETSAQINAEASSYTYERIYVEFDVAVEESSGRAGTIDVAFPIVAGKFSVFGGGKKQTSELSRLKFKVPIKLPKKSR